MDNNNPDSLDAFRPPADGGGSPEFDPAAGTARPAAPMPTPAPAPSRPPLAPALFPYATNEIEPALVEPDRVATPRRAWLSPVLGGLIGAALLAGVLWAGGVFDDNQPLQQDATATGQPAAVREVVTAGEQASATAVARKVVPSIVTVDVGTNSGDSFRPFASGSGVVLSDDGLIITNHHVIEDAERVQVIFGDGRIYEAEIVGSDRRTDLAVLRINAIGLIPIEIGSTESAEIGEVAIAVGSPLGLDGGPSLTVGVVSAFGRQVQTGPNASDILFDMLQTDAPITEGSSGGALVDSEGRLLGITSAIGISSAGAEGIGFAIPVELVTRITDEIIETGQVEHAFLGIELDIAFEETRDGALIPAGVLVNRFAIEQSAAAQAGVAQGDLIVAYNGNTVSTEDDLISGLRRLRVGEVVTLSIVRGSERIEIDVVLGARPDDV